ncbi:Short-chain dehydrogenase/reductase SDR [Lasiodiplodia theobromae]|uniref:Short-chain dehydrogenase/reductase SDR n=1 Tax=Lasiodiplodia theobromae TaxID=45133 RepID=UPI0015C349B2|nr:Short-chain dehydrogenase/reductase SDR [Lasiodiplodia theobromae]KAF4536653.1 Short-chain dehydrogenase/reductase SDR [Lasiodiplodia theobromae]
MHEAIILANWPSCLNSLAWSHDCILALAAGETVELLIPVLSADSDDVDTGLQGTQHWINVHIRTNQFTSTEVPPIDPLPLRASSVGEEISTSDTSLIEWSPPGLAKHARCALAVLTTNLTLSLWVSDSDPKVTRSWKRVLILNHELEMYFQELYAHEEFRLELDCETRRRLRRRIRSFAWSPQLRPPPPSQYSVQEARFPINGSFIAVSNDNNDVVILRIDSPYSFFSPPSAKWSARAVAHFSLEPKLDMHQGPRLFLLAETLSEQRFISNLAWSPWTIDPDGVPTAILAYTTNCSVHLRRVRIPPFSADVSLDQTDVFSDSSAGTRNVHLLRWMPKARDDVFYLVAFSQAGAFCFEVPCLDPSKTTVSTHDLDGRWDTVSDLSAEALIYCTKTWLEELPEESRAESAVRSTILEQFWRALGLSNDHDDDPVVGYPEARADGLDLEERTSLAQALRRAVYYNDRSILKQRYGRLLTLFFDPKGTTQSDDAPAIQKLVTEVLKLPRSSYNDSEASRKIRTVYSSMLPWLSDAETDGMDDGAVETSTDKHVEECEICDDSIGFESFAWARCGQGHEFVRCSLTFLAIQAPGISKLCGICGKRYLNEEFVVRTDKLAGAAEARQSGDSSQQDVVMPDADGGQQEGILPSTEANVTAGEGSSKQGGSTGQDRAPAVDYGRSPITLARILFAACDVCIYCGGKFVG